MKIGKEATKLSKALLRASMAGGKLDLSRASKAVAFVAERKPRNYLAALKRYQRLVRLEVQKRSAVIESAFPLDEATSKAIEASLRAKFGADLGVEFSVVSELISGVRLRIGSDVWESSVRSRLRELAVGLA